MTTTYDRFVEMLRACAVRGEVPAHVASAAIQPNTRLIDLGIDSLGRMNLLAAVMQLADRYYPDSTFSEEMTIGQIARLVDESAPEKS